MIRYLCLYLTDGRLRAALKAIGAAGPALGDLAKNPGDAPRFFRPHLLRFSAVRREPARASAGEVSPARGALPAAAADFTARLEKFFNDLALQKTAIDPALEQALLYLQAACAEAPRLLSTGSRAGALEKIRGLSAVGARTLRIARDAALARATDFPQNLKFCSIYSGLDAVFEAFERCAVALHES